MIPWRFSKFAYLQDGAVEFMKAHSLRFGPTEQSEFLMIAEVDSIGVEECGSLRLIAGETEVFRVTVFL